MRIFSKLLKISVVYTYFYYCYFSIYIRKTQLQIREIQIIGLHINGNWLYEAPKQNMLKSVTSIAEQSDTMLIILEHF